MTLCARPSAIGTAGSHSIAQAQCRLRHGQQHQRAPGARAPRRRATTPSGTSKASTASAVPRCHWHSAGFAAAMEKLVYAHQSAQGDLQQQQRHGRQSP